MHVQEQIVQYENCQVLQMCFPVFHSTQLYEKVGVFP